MAASETLSQTPSLFCRSSYLQPYRQGLIQDTSLFLCLQGYNFEDLFSPALTRRKRSQSLRDPLSESFVKVTCTVTGAAGELHDGKRHRIRFSPLGA